MAEQRIEPVFTEFIPEDIVAGKLYISVRFRTATHLCACGCGLKVVTPIKPAKWRFTYDGETVTLAPSIGRWQLPCKSHYNIVKSRITWAREFSADEMRWVQLRDSRDIHEYYEGRQAPSDRVLDPDDLHDARVPQPSGSRSNLVAKVVQKLRRRRSTGR